MVLRVLIVDDSALMRRWLKQCFDTPDFVVEIARSGRDALAKIDSFDPDVITLDINMPEMDGLTCLSHIMTSSPRPVIMVSSLTSKGATATIEAMALGAIDFIEKPGGTVSHNIKDVFPEIIAKVKAAAGARMRTTRTTRSTGGTKARRSETPAPRSAPRVQLGRIKLVVVGVSTGGPGTLEEILSALPQGLSAPIVIAQHIPPRFASVFAERLNAKLPITVTYVSGTHVLEPGVIYVAGAEGDVTVGQRAGRLVAKCVPADPQHTWHPSVDRLVDSAMKDTKPSSILGIQLTGMGDDGARAMAMLKANGGHTIAESEDTAVIFGMPRVLIEMGGASEVLPSTQIAKRITEILSPRSRMQNRPPLAR